VFLHGPRVYNDGEWEPILLDVLHEVGFQAASRLRYEQRLTLYRSVSASGMPGIIGSHLESDQIQFGVVVEERSGGRWEFVVNKDAIRWLNKVARHIQLSRSCQEVRRITKGKGPLEPLSDLQSKKLQKLLARQVRGINESLEIVESFDNDPKTFQEYEAKLKRRRSKPWAFKTFFDQAFEELSRMLEESKALEPILLTADGDIFVQNDPPGLHKRNLRDGSKLAPGKHLYCGGIITFKRISETTQVVVCNGECNLSVSIPLSIENFTDLRARGEQLKLAVDSEGRAGSQP